MSCVLIGREQKMLGHMGEEGRGGMKVKSRGNINFLHCFLNVSLENLYIVYLYVHIFSTDYLLVKIQHNCLYGYLETRA